MFNAFTGLETLSFFAYTPAFTGGVRAAAGDVDGDGQARTSYAGPGPGGQDPHVQVFSGADGSQSSRASSRTPPAFTGGVFVDGG